MAYDASGARIGAAGHFASRITAALIAAGGIEPSEAAASDTFANLTENCLAVLNGLEGSTTVAPPPAAVQQQVEAAFPGTTEVQQPAVAGGSLRIIGQEGDAPAWLYEQAAKAGVTAVYDNRSDLAGNPKRPWFKQAEPKVANSRDAKGFWPPR